MYPVSEEYINRIMSSSVNSEWVGTITLEDGTKVCDLNSDNLQQGKSKITRAICGGNSLELGTTCSTEFSFGVYLDIDRYALYGATVTLDFILYLDDTRTEKVPCGKFTIIEPPTRYLGTIQGYAYDNMYKFDKSFAKTTSGSPFELLLMACIDCGVDLGMTEDEIQRMSNGRRDAYVYNAGAETYRDLIGYVASYLGGVAVIGTDGALYIKQYDTRSVRTISSDWRYDYRPQDYETFYTSVSMVNADSKAVEIVSLSGISENQEGLIYELGEHPLLQFSELAERKSAMQGILDAISAVSYTPFTASVPCDPALECGDIVDFIDGVAVPGKVSAITSMTIKINGGMEIKCVGSNPHTSNIKTKTDKVLSSVASNMSSAEVVTYGYTNAKEVFAENRRLTPLLQLLFTTATKTPKIDIWIEVLLDTNSIEPNGLVDLLDPMTVTVTYSLNGKQIEYMPVETYAVAGKHILGLHYFIPEVEPNTRYTWLVSLTMYNGTAFMGPDCIHAFLNGQGLVSEEGLTGLGYIDVTDEVYCMDVRGSLALTKTTDVLSVKTGRVDRNSGFTELFKGINIRGKFNLSNINTQFGDGITYLKAAEFITVADTITMTINRDYVATDTAFELKTKYQAVSENLAVDRGSLCVVNAYMDGVQTESVEIVDE